MSELTTRDVVALVEDLYPPRLAASWDKIGLICGRLEQLVTGVTVAVDLTDSVIDFALENSANFILVHHPMFLSGVHEVSETGFKGRLIHRLIENQLALMVAHTNADSARPGVSDALAQTLGVSETKPLELTSVQGLSSIVVYVPHGHVDQVVDALAKAGAGRVGNYDRCAFTSEGQGTFRPGVGTDPYIGQPGVVESTPEVRVEMVCQNSMRRAVVEAIMTSHPYEQPAFSVIPMADVAQVSVEREGIGRIGRLEQPVSLREFAERVAQQTPTTAQGVRVAGDPNKHIEWVAVCGGSGDSYLDLVNSLRADVYVTSDLKHHRTRDHVDAGGCAVIDIPHWASEFPWCESAKEQLTAQSAALGTPISVVVCPEVTDPWAFHVQSTVKP